jgi:carbon monoxide dehydrogenase subunit G
MATTVNSITIDRPAEDVFAVATDVTKTGRWFPGDVEEYWTTPPPHGVGSVRRAIITVMGRRAENDATVTEFDPPRRGVLVGSQQGVTWTGTVECAPTEGGTLLTFTFDARVSGAARLFMRPFLNWYSSSWKTGLANLKRMMESGEL